MPTHEKMRVAAGADVTDLVPEDFFRRAAELQGHLNGSIPGTVNTYVANTPDASDTPLGTDPSVAIPTTVTGVTGAGAAGTFDLAIGGLGAGNAGCEYIIRKTSDGSFVRKADKNGTGTTSITGLGTAVSYTVDVRGYISATDGRVGRQAARVTVTSHA